MITKEEFREYIDKLKEFNDFTEEFGKLLDCDCEKNYDVMETYLDLLIKIMGDKETEENNYIPWIIHYCWESNFGRRSEFNFDKVDFMGKDSDFLYDLIKYGAAATKEEEI